MKLAWSVAPSVVSPLDHLDVTIGGVIGGYKRMRTKRNLTNAMNYTLGQVIGYLERNKRQMRYHVYLEKGVP